MKLASGSLHRHGIVLLGPEVLEIARTKIESNVNKKYNRILGCMRKCFEMLKLYRAAVRCALRCTDKFQRQRPNGAPDQHGRQYGRGQR